MSSLFSRTVLCRYTWWYTKVQNMSSVHSMLSAISQSGFSLKHLPSPHFVFCSTLKKSGCPNFSYSHHFMSWHGASHRLWKKLSVKIQISCTLAVSYRTQLNK